MSGKVNFMKIYRFKSKNLVKELSNVSLEKMFCFYNKGFFKEGLVCESGKAVGVYNRGEFI